MILYKSILGSSVVEETIEKSRFIGYVKPINSREEALGFINECKSMNREATHNVPAFVIGERQELQWCSDDGEPQGSSGQPILKMISSEGLTNIAVVVSRYYGGIKLGTGGLVRAYSSVAKEAIIQAGICKVSKGKILKIISDYKDFQKILKSTENVNYAIENQSFGQKIEANLLIEWENKDKVIKELMDLTNGRFKIISESDRLVKIGIDNKNTVC